LLYNYLMEITATCQNTGKKFLITKQEIEFCKKWDLPLPVLHPEIRREMRERLMPSPFYSWTKCDHCGKRVLIEHPDTMDRKVICVDCRDKYYESVTPAGVDYIPGKFLEQYHELIKQNPIRGYDEFRKEQGGGENLTRCVECSYSKNCIECFDTSKCINCVNCQEGLISDTDCVDLTQSSGCELCVDMIGCLACYKCAYLEDCDTCENTYYSDNCRRTKYCFGCSGLRDKSFCIFNKQYSEKEYKEKVAELLKKTPDEIEELKSKELADVPVPASLGGTGNVDSFYTNQTMNCKSTYYAFYSQETVESGYLWQCEGVNNVWDITMTRNSDYAYQASDTTYSKQIFFASGQFECEDCWFGMDNYKTHHAWGCVHLSDKKYHILNKEYSKEDYEKLVPQIRDELNLHYNGQ
jgi:hypothetical protein